MQLGARVLIINSGRVIIGEKLLEFDLLVLRFLFIKKKAFFNALAILDDIKCLVGSRDTYAAAVWEKSLKCVHYWSMQEAHLNLPYTKGTGVFRYVSEDIATRVVWAAASVVLWKQKIYLLKLRKMFLKKVGFLHFSKRNNCKYCLVFQVNLPL